ncbi:DUF4062 domain-containing protein [Clostridium perfringens]|nr:MAG TPA: protein of unknown function (DUF4062) [Bacteriophage sp.]
MKKKLQIFISSTYLDLQEEREAAVEAVLGSKHIPAGMELFRAGNKSQLETIKKWINESDIYMLILGGRYGSIEPDSGKSYTQLEYEYALEKEMPIFAVVLKDEFLHKKAANKEADVMKDISNPKFQEFKNLVMSKMIKEVEDCKDIKLAIKDSIIELDEEYDLVGWVRATEVEDNNDVIQENMNLNKEIAKLIKEKSKLNDELKRLKETIKSKKQEYEVIKESLKRESIVIPGKIFNKEEDAEVDYLKCFEVFSGEYAIGVNNKLGMSDFKQFLFFQLAPKYISLGLLEIKKVAGHDWRLIELSNEGKKFLKKLAEDKLK